MRREGYLCLKSVLICQDPRVTQICVKALRPTVRSLTLFLKLVRTTMTLLGLTLIQKPHFLDSEET